MQGSNYNAAKAESDRIDKEIIATLQKGENFRVEAGAGSGKTYSLKKVIEWIQENKRKEYSLKKQNVVCITYTNAAVNVLAERLSDNSFIVPSTIHSFAWHTIKQYQSALIHFIKQDHNFISTQDDSSAITEVQYTLGYRYKEHGIQYLYHDDVLKLFCKLLDSPKFRRVFSDKYPLILIDEYQDTYKPIIDRFIKYFIATNEGSKLGFFGDSWQTIYQINNSCGLIEHKNLKVINKGSNFRSAPKIVQLLNKIRPELPQKSAIDDFEGKVIAITCDDFTGQRQTDRFWKDDLPDTELQKRVQNIKEYIEKNTPTDETEKILMITHKVLAKQQGYEKLLNKLQGHIRDNQDIFLMFFKDTVEPIYNALENNNMQLLFDTLKVKRYPISKKSEKSKWKIFKEALCKAREKKAIDVLDTVMNYQLIPIPPDISSNYHKYQEGATVIYSDKTTLKDFLDTDYKEFLSVISFLCPETAFSTEHGVKGEEYDNVVFVISKGWYKYEFSKYIPMLNGSVSIPDREREAYERNRNLFYVCCSRAKKRLVILITVPTTSELKATLADFIGESNIYTYSQFFGNENSHLI